MTAELNQLFEEGIARSGELTDAADEAMNAIDDMVQSAEAATRRVQDEGAEACRHLREIVTRIDHAEGEVEAARGHADGALEGLAAAAAGVKTEVAELLDRVKTNVAELEAQQQRIDDSLDGQMSSTEADFSELAQKTQDLETAAARHLEEAATAVAVFRSAIDRARAEFAQKIEAWAAASDALETHAQEQAQAWTTGLHDLLTRQAATMVETANALVDRHNEAMQHLKERFVEQAPQELASALEPVRTAVEHLGETATSRKQALTSRVDELEHAAKAAVSALEAIRADLGSTARLE